MRTMIQIKKWQLMILLLMAAAFVISSIGGFILEWGLFGTENCK